MERLFNNQIQPQARPIGAFINPEQFRRANPGQPTLLGGVSQIATLQQAGTSGVKGYNQFDQVTRALAPFSKSLTSLADKGFEYYAKSSIESGYYEEMQNETQRAKLQFQRNQEAGAADAAQTQTQLAKVDPVGASLLREANPWKAIGRRRALAQMASGQISAALNGDIANNAGELAGIKPGSPALMERKQTLTQEVLGRYGLTGDEPEAAYYVVPQMNKSWDQYTKKQSELYNDEIYQSTIELTNASVLSTIQTISSDGVTLPDGSTIAPGDPRFGVVAGQLLTMRLDQGLSLLGGEDRVNAMKKIKESLGSLYGMNIPGVRDAIGNIRLGNRNVPMEKRPRWMDANPFELMDYTTKGMEQVKKQDGLRQAEKERELKSRLLSITGLTSNDPEYASSVQELRQFAVDNNIRNGEQIINGFLAENEQTNVEVYAPSAESVYEWEQAMENLTPEDVSPENIEQLKQATLARAQLIVGAPERQKFIKESLARIDRAREKFAGLPTNAALQGNLTRLMMEDLADSDISKLKGKGRVSFLEYGNLQIQGADNDEKAQRYATFGRSVRGLYQREFAKQITQWRNDNPGQTEVPVDVQAALWDETAKVVRGSEQFKNLKEAAINAPPATRSDGTPRSQQFDPDTSPVPKDAADTIPSERARKYQNEPIMNQYWLRSEMQSLSSGQPVSRQLYDLAKSAGTSTDRYLVEQLKFFPALDPQGKFRGVLQKRIERDRQTNTPAASNFEPATDPLGNQSFNPRSPGEWLMSMFTPPAAAATLPPPSVAPPPEAVNGTWTTPSGFEIRQYVTGDVTAPHNGGSVIVDTAGHGGDAYHNHYEFATAAQRVRAAKLFRSLGFRVTSEVRPGDSGAHGAGLGLDVAPPLDLPRTPAAEAAWSRRANAVLGFKP